MFHKMGRKRKMATPSEPELGMQKEQQPPTKVCRTTSISGSEMHTLGTRLLSLNVGYALPNIAE